jgi:hypothetical protein
MLGKQDEELDLLPRLEEQFSYDSNNARENVSHTTKEKLIKTVTHSVSLAKWLMDKRNLLR